MTGWVIAGFILLVMPVLAIAPEVDHHVAVKFLAERDCQPRRVNACLRIVAVHMEDRRLDHLGDVGGIRREAPLTRQRREADLVVHDHVDRPARAVVRKLGQTQGLVDDALPAERGVAVQHDGHDAGSRGVIAQVILLGAHDADDHRVHQLQVAGVVAERDVDLPITDDAVLGIAQVILHIPVAIAFLVGLCGPLKFPEDDLVRLVEDMGQDVKPAAMRHPQDNFLHAQAPRRLLPER